MGLLSRQSLSFDIHYLDYQGGGLDRRSEFTPELAGG